MKKILILVDYNDYFYSSAVRKIFTMDVEKVKSFLEEDGYTVEVRNFCDINFRKDDFEGVYVLYTSQEDPDLKYKSFIEDIILGLKEKGAILIPDFKYFRAHHNKVFMEILRDISTEESIKNISSQCFGTKEEFDKVKNNISWPKVLKSSEGSTSLGVSLVNEKNVDQKVKKTAFSFTFLPHIKDFIKKLIKRPRYPLSFYRNKFLVQNYVEGLSGDFKVLIYGDKYYILRRENRENDFRASGSGKFSWPESVSESLLNYAQKIYCSFNVPFISLDIGVKNKEYFLIEFQFVMFGTYTLEASDFFYTKHKDEWKKWNEISDLENVFAYSLKKHIEKH